LQTADLFKTDAIIVHHVTETAATTLRRWTVDNVKDDVMLAVTSGRLVIDYVIGPHRAGETSTAGFIIKFECK
jgi:hypothetical protein